MNLRLTLLHRYNLHVVPLEEPSGLFVVVRVPLAELFLQHLDINPVPFSCPSAIYQGCMGMTRIILDFQLGMVFPPFLMLQRNLRVRFNRSERRDEPSRAGTPHFAISQELQGRRSSKNIPHRGSAIKRALAIRSL